MNAADFAAWTGGILALLGILAVLVKILRVAHQTANRMARVESLATELEHNGGGSIKDAVHRTDGKVAQILDRLEDHDVRIAKNEGRIEAIALVTSPTMLIEDEGGVLREHAEPVNPPPSQR